MKGNIDRAVSILKQGGVIALPTETVYGLGADAKNPAALQKIFHIKQRPTEHPLIVHLADFSQLPAWASAISDSALQLAKHFWPGPLTLILKKASRVSDLITGGQDTIGLRVPRHPVAQAVLKAFGGGIAAPSANRFGRLSPTTAEAVREELGDAVDLILEGGQCEIGVESTIVDVSGEHPAILRPGMITAFEIEAVLNQDLVAKKNTAPRVSGSLESHYAPNTKTRLVHIDERNIFLKNLQRDDFPLVWLSREENSLVDFVKGKIDWIKMPENPEDYAHEMYHVLREQDKKHFKQIIVECVPEDLAWDAIRDRLQRASCS